jgi:multiple sugar transport system substrate-binding protein
MKRALCVLMILLAACALFGQGKELTGVDPKGAVITYWFQHTSKNGEEMMKMIADFNANNEWGITVKGEFAGPYDQIYNKMVAAIVAQNPPELVVAYQNQSATYAVSDALVDMNIYVKDPKWGLGKDLADYFPGIINQDVNAQFGGKRLGFPPNRSLEVMYVNMAMLKAAGIKEAPKTWKEFADDCAKVTSAEKGTYGYALDNLDASHIFAFVVSRGGEIARADGKGYTLNTPQVKETMTFMKGLVDKGYARKIPKKYDDQNDFGNGLACFTTGSTSGYNYYKAAVEKGKSGAFEWTIAPIPQTTATAKPAMDLYGASVSIPKSTPQKQLAAWLFIKWMGEPKQQAQWAHVSKYFPVRAAAEPLIKDMLDTDPIYAKAWSILKTANLKAEPPYAGYDLVRDAINASYSAILDGADVTTTLADLETKANKLFKDSAP